MSISIRKVEIGDSSRLLEIYKYYVENTVISFEYETPSLQEFENRIRNITQKYPYLVAEIDGKIVGYSYAGVFKGRAAYDYSCEMTVYVDKEYKKNGIGKALYNAIEVELKKQGMKNLYACIGYPEVDDEYLDKNSYNFHQHMGYTLVGKFNNCGYKFNRWYSMVWMEKIIGEHN
ncbi:MAG: N-acetyltransferase family protein [Clostridia bacterium]|nr:N-acetyltransferase family protein [Clostridia bacterium]